MDISSAFPLFEPWDFRETAITDFFFSEDNYLVFHSFIDHLQNKLLMIVHNFMQVFMQILYFVRVKPVEWLNHNRKDFCLALPEYGTEEYLKLLDEHPLRFVYCSQWFSKRLMFIEEIFMAPYRMFKMVYDHISAMFTPKTPVQETAPAVEEIKEIAPAIAQTAEVVAF